MSFVRDTTGQLSLSIGGCCSDDVAALLPCEPVG